MKLRELIHACQCMAVCVNAYDPEWQQDELRLPVNPYCPEALLEREVEFISIVAELAPLMPGKELGYRICSNCGRPFDKGYCHDGGPHYYCDSDCLHTKFTDEEWEEECEKNEDSYRTTWRE